MPEISGIMDKKYPVFGVYYCEGGTFMQIKKTALALTVTASILVGTVIGANGAGTAQTISALLRSDYTVKYNGEEQILKDANGERVYPISYNGSTYVPFRALGDIIGLDVGWDAATNTVMYNTPTKPSEPEKPASKRLDLIDECHLFDRWGLVYPTQKNQKIKIGNDTVDHWIRLGLFGYYVTYNLTEEYDTLSLKVYTSYDAVITVYSNNTKDAVLDSFKVQGFADPSLHEIPINGTLQIRIEATYDKFVGGKPTEDDYLYIYNAYLT